MVESEKSEHNVVVFFAQRAFSVVEPNIYTKQQCIYEILKLMKMINFSDTGIFVYE